MITWVQQFSSASSDNVGGNNETFFKQTDILIDKLQAAHAVVEGPEEILRQYIEEDGVIYTDIIAEEWNQKDKTYIYTSGRYKDEFRKVSPPTPTKWQAEEIAVFCNNQTLHEEDRSLDSNVSHESAEVYRHSYCRDGKNYIDVVREILYSNRKEYVYVLTRVRKIYLGTSKPTPVKYYMDSIMAFHKSIRHMDEMTSRLDCC